MKFIFLLLALMMPPVEQELPKEVTPPAESVVPPDPIDILEQELPKIDKEETYKDWKRGEKKFVDLTATEKQIFYIYRAEQYVMKVHKVFKILDHAYDSTLRMSQDPDLSDDQIVNFIVEVSRYKSKVLRVHNLREKAIDTHLGLIDEAIEANKDDVVLVRDLTQYKKRCISNYTKANALKAK